MRSAQTLSLSLFSFPQNLKFFVLYNSFYRYFFTIREKYFIFHFITAKVTFLFSFLLRHKGVSLQLPPFVTSNLVIFAFIRCRFTTLNLNLFLSKKLDINGQSFDWLCLLSKFRHLQQDATTCSSRIPFKIVKTRKFIRRMQ